MLYVATVTRPASAEAARSRGICASSAPSVASRYGAPRAARRCWTSTTSHGASRARRRAAAAAAAAAAPARAGRRPPPPARPAPFASSSSSSSWRAGRAGRGRPRPPRGRPSRPRPPIGRAAVSRRRFCGRAPSPSASTRRSRARRAQPLSQTAASPRQQHLEPARRETHLAREVRRVSEHPESYPNYAKWQRQLGARRRCSRASASSPPTAPRARWRGTSRRSARCSRCCVAASRAARATAAAGSPTRRARAGRARDRALVPRVQRRGIGAFAVIIGGGLYERFDRLHYLLVCGGLDAPLLLQARRALAALSPGDAVGDEKLRRPLSLSGARPRSSRCSRRARDRRRRPTAGGAAGRAGRAAARVAQPQGERVARHLQLRRQLLVHALLLPCSAPSTRSPRTTSTACPSPCSSRRTSTSRCTTRSRAARCAARAARSRRRARAPRSARRSCSR